MGIGRMTHQVFLDEIGPRLGGMVVEVVGEKEFQIIGGVSETNVLQAGVDRPTKRRRWIEKGKTDQACLPSFVSMSQDLSSTLMVTASASELPVTVTTGLESITTAVPLFQPPAAVSKRNLK